MSRIRSAGNRSTELRLVSLMKEAGITGWRRRFGLMGNPDFVFPKERVAVFVDGCFWHGCPRCRNIPLTNAAYWAAKNERNRTRDRLVARLLRREGWTVVRIWEHSFRRPKGICTKLQEALAAARQRVPGSTAMHKVGSICELSGRKPRAVPGIQMKTKM